FALAVVVGSVTMEAVAQDLRGSAAAAVSQEVELLGEASTESAEGRHGAAVWGDAAAAESAWLAAPPTEGEWLPGRGTQVSAQEAQKKRQAASAKASQAFKGVFYDNDFSYLSDPWYDDFYPGEGLKRLPMPHDGELDFGGELRLRYHSEHNMRGQGLTGLDDDFLLTRMRLFTNYRINDYFRFYGEYLFADSGGENIGNRPIEVNRGEAQNLFLDA